MKISEFDIILEYQTDDNYIAEDKKTYFGSIYRKEELKCQMSSYIDGYREAIEAIYERFKMEAENGHIWVQDTIIYPLIFNHRHCVELELKRLFCLKDNKFDQLKSNTNHNLCAIWSNLQYFIVERATRLGISYNIAAIDHYINTIESLDEGSFRFRYPMNKELESSNTELTLLNVETFHHQMNQFHDDMADIYDSLSNQVDDWELNKDFKRHFKFCLSKNIDELKSVLDYKYPKYKIPDKPWLCSSEVPYPTEEEIENEIRYCHAISKDIKELLLILFNSLFTLHLNKITPPNSPERLNDILRVCNDTYSNENIFGHNNLDRIFLDKFSCLIYIKDQIISLADEIVGLIKTES